MDAIEEFEELAKAFYRETGMMAPGKDCPLGTHDHETRWACWRVWLKVQGERDRLRAEAADLRSELDAANKRADGIREGRERWADAAEKARAERIDALDAHDNLAASYRDLRKEALRKTQALEAIRMLSRAYIARLPLEGNEALHAVLGEIYQDADAGITGISSR